MLRGRKHRSIVLSHVFLVGWLFVTASTSRAQQGTWTTKASLPTARLGLATCVVDGKIYALGGYAAANSPGQTTVEAYDPVTDSWTAKAPMPTRRRWLACSAVAGKIYAIGGHRTVGEPALPTVEAYDVATDTWTTRAPMPTARKGLATAMVDGKIYAIGGASVDEQRLATVERYDPVTDRWSPGAPMLTARALLSTSVVDGKIFAIGGPSPGSAGISTVEAYDPASDTWVTKHSMPTARWGLATSSVGGIIYAMGGHNGSGGLSVVEAYDPVKDAWTTMTSMPENDQSEAGVRWGLATSTVDGVIYAMGGSSVPLPPHPGSVSVQAYTAPLVATGVADPSSEQIYPESIALHANYPNPFTPSTDIRFELPEAQPVRLVVYDVLGRAVRVLVDGVLETGRHEVVFEASHLPSGTYLYRLETPKNRLTGTMQLMR